MTERLIENGRRVDHAYKVADLVWRFCRQKRFAPDKTYGRIFANKVTDLSGDQVDLDMTEEEFNEIVMKLVIPPFKPDIGSIEWSDKTEDFNQWYREPKA